MAWQGENFGFALKKLAEKIEPSRPAMLYGERAVTWGEFDSLTDSIAADLSARGLGPGDIAGQMLRNTPEYMLAFFGCAKAGVVPVNVNYHYKDRELADIFRRFGLKALFVESDFAEAAAGAMPEGTLEPIVADPASADWLGLCESDLPESFAVHEDKQALFLTATGGTTGMPKAVMWPHQAAWQAFGVSVWQQGMGEPPFVASSMDQQAERAAEIAPGHPHSASPMLVLSPLMHGAAQFTTLISILKGGTIALLPSPKFDANAAVDAVRDYQAKNLFIVGDAFALPLADALDARADSVDAFKSLRAITSSGAVFSEENKRRLIAHNKNLAIYDALGSSESSGTAIIVTTAAGSSGGGKFAALPGRTTKLFDEKLNEVKPGSNEIGIVARSGPLPIGYLGEDEKNAQTFPEIDGQRYLMTGDRARWSADGTLEFIGRDNMCINTGGEKVFPEEVEAVLQAHPDVKDVRIVSLPDPRFGRKVVAVVQPEHDRADLEAKLDEAARAGLAGYKIPRAYFFTSESLRLNNGKPDYKVAQRLADEAAE